MTELFSLDAYHSDRRSSKGNQLKFEKNHIWYKADYLGYEGLAEYVISRLLHYSTLQESEERLDWQRENDPLNIGQFKATKAFAQGNNSFDDRSYIRFKV